MLTERRSKEVWRGRVGKIVGKKLGGKKTIYYNVDVRIGDKVTKFMRLEKRVVKTLGSGTLVAGDWVKVREWPEVETKLKSSL